MGSAQKSRSLLNLLQESGFKSPDTLIHLFVGGSELHGAKVGETDDTDIYGVYIEPPAQALGLDPQEHFVWSTAGDERRNGPEDVDVTLYSLQKWAAMAAKGNATALHFLFADPQEISPESWRQIQANRHLFLSRASAKQFLGFAENQFKGLPARRELGKRANVPNTLGNMAMTLKLQCMACVCSTNAWS